MVELLWQYFLIFIMAATPWLEILIVIPIGIGMGLDPFWVGFISFAGNFLPILLIIYSLKWFQRTKWYKQWKARRRRKKEQKELKKREERAVAENLDQEAVDHSDQPVTRDIRDGRDAPRRPKKTRRTRKEQAASIFHKYGLPGLAILGPAVTGIHLAAVIALSLKADQHKTTAWMGGSLVVWTIILTAASYYGIDWVTNLFS